MRRLISSLVFLSLQFSTFSIASGTLINISNHSHDKTAKPYSKSPYVDDLVWETVKPYFLPFNHPIRAKLDKIFSEKRVTLSSDTLEEAGFLSPRPRKFSHTIISKHPELKGFLIKAFADDQIGYTDWKRFINRIKGAKSIQKAIDTNGYGRYFKVPKKWIYPLPHETPLPNDTKYQRKNFILVVEDMEICDTEKNKNKFRYCITPSILEALFVILRDEQLTDSVHIMNIPFSKDGRISFIDTEFHHAGIPPYRIMRRYLSISMRKNLDQLIKLSEPK